MLNTAPITQAASAQVESPAAAMTAGGFMKAPAPSTIPTTMARALTSPISFFSSAGLFVSSFVMGFSPGVLHRRG